MEFGEAEILSESENSLLDEDELDKESFFELLSEADKAAIRQKVNDQFVMKSVKIKLMTCENFIKEKQQEIIDLKHKFDLITQRTEDDQSSRNEMWEKLKNIGEMIMNCQEAFNQVISVKESCKSNREEMHLSNEEVINGLKNILKEVASTNEQHFNKVESLKDAIKIQKENNKKREKENNQIIEKKKEIIRSLKEQCFKAKERLKEKEIKCEKIMEDIGKQKGEKEYLSTECSQLKNKIDMIKGKLEEEVSNYTTQKNNFEQTKKEDMKKIETLMSERNDMEKVLQEQNKEVEEMQKKNNILENKLSEIEEQNSTILKNIIEVDDQIQKQREQFEKEMNQNQEKLVALKKVHNNQTGKNEGLKKKLGLQTEISAEVELKLKESGEKVEQAKKAYNEEITRKQAIERETLKIREEIARIKANRVLYHEKQVKKIEEKQKLLEEKKKERDQVKIAFQSFVENADEKSENTKSSLEERTKKRDELKEQIEEIKRKRKEREEAVEEELKSLSENYKQQIQSKLEETEQYKKDIEDLRKKSEQEHREKIKQDLEKINTGNLQISEMKASKEYIEKELNRLMHLECTLYRELDDYRRIASVTSQNQFQKNASLQLNEMQETNYDNNSPIQLSSEPSNSSGNEKSMQPVSNNPNQANTKLDTSPDSEKSVETDLNKTKTASKKPETSTDREISLDPILNKPTPPVSETRNTRELSKKPTNSPPLKIKPAAMNMAKKIQDNLSDSSLDQPLAKKPHWSDSSIDEQPLSTLATQIKTTYAQNNAKSAPTQRCTRSAPAHKTAKSATTLNRSSSVKNNTLITPSTTANNNSKSWNSQNNHKSVTSQNNAKSVTAQGKAKSVTAQSKAKSVTSQSNAKSVTSQSNAKSVTLLSNAKSVTPQSNTKSVIAQSSAKSGLSQGDKTDNLFVKPNIPAISMSKKATWSDSSIDADDQPLATSTQKRPVPPSNAWFAAGLNNARPSFTLNSSTEDEISFAQSQLQVSRVYPPQSREPDSWSEDSNYDRPNRMFFKTQKFPAVKKHNSDILSVETLQETYVDDAQNKSRMTRRKAAEDIRKTRTTKSVSAYQTMNDLFNSLREQNKDPESSPTFRQPMLRAPLKLPTQKRKSPDTLSD